jgi:hypothetical protein
MFMFVSNQPNYGNYQTCGLYIEDEQKAACNKLQKLRNERRGSDTHLFYLEKALTRSVFVSERFNNSFTGIALWVLKSLKTAARQILAAPSLKLQMTNL